MFQTVENCIQEGKNVLENIILFWWPNYRYSAFKNPIYDIEFSFHQLIFQSLAAFAF